MTIEEFVRQAINGIFDGSYEHASHSVAGYTNVGLDIATVGNRIANADDSPATISRIKVQVPMLFKK